MARVCRRLLDEGGQFQWFIIGDGPDLPAEKKLVNNFGIGDIVKFTGQINFEDIGPYLHVLDIGVPRKLIEEVRDEK